MANAINRRLKICIRKLCKIFTLCHLESVHHKTKEHNYVYTIRPNIFAFKQYTH